MVGAWPSPRPSPRSKVLPSPRRKGPDFTAQRFNNNPDQVAQTKLCAEVYGKLENTEVEASEFKFNPLTAAPITPKPTRVTPSIPVSKQEFEDAKKLLEEVYPIKNIGVPPVEKYVVPMTSSQEYGWCSEPLVTPRKLFSFPHESCEITAFAAAYFELRRTSPFAAKDFVPRHVLKERAQRAEAAAAAKAAALATPRENQPVPTPRENQPVPTPRENQPVPTPRDQLAPA